jgi:hypothetical protein
MAPKEDMGVKKAYAGKWDKIACPPTATEMTTACKNKKLGRNGRK